MINLVRIPGPDVGVQPLREPRTKGTKGSTKPKFSNVVWTTDQTKNLIAGAHQGNQCSVCELVLGTGKQGARRMAVLAKQHFVCMHSPCRYHSQSRDSLSYHQNSDEGYSCKSGERCIHDVGAETYPAFARAVGLPQAEFPHCILTLLAEGKNQLNKFRLPVRRGTPVRKDSGVPLTQRRVTMGMDAVEPLEEGELVKTEARNSNLRVILSQATEILGKEVLTSPHRCPVVSPRLRGWLNSPSQPTIRRNRWFHSQL